MRKKIVFLLIGLIFIAFQFYRPLELERSKVTLDDLILSNKPSKEIADLLINTCYDCHSEQTKDYWYSNVVPVAWLLDKDIKEGKAKLNFSIWERYPHNKKIELAGEIMYQMYQGKMPIKAYKLIHRQADLAKSDQNKITNWINSLVE